MRAALDINWPMAAIDQVKALRAEQPTIRAAEIADVVGITRQRASQILRELGLPTRVKKASRRLSGPLRQTLSVSSGSAAELRVCIDLLHRGFDVFRSVSACAKCDLIMMSRTAPYRPVCVQVKAARSTKNGSLSFVKPFPPDAHDVLALVLPDRIIYRPQL